MEESKDYYIDVDIDICIFLEGFGFVEFGFGKFGIGKKSWYRLSVFSTFNKYFVSSM